MDKKTNTLWTEKYRPQSLDEFVGNQHLKDKVGIYLQNNDIPHLLFFGKAGCGKTSISKIIRNNIECDHLYINASDENSIETVRKKVKSFASSVGFQDIKICILDEADFITGAGQSALRNLMETFSQTTRFILTCNYKERIIDPLQSRCQIFEVIPPSKKEVGQRILEILNSENVAFDKKDVALIINSLYPDIRRIINALQMQTVNGTLVVDKVSVIQNDYKLKLLEILKIQNKKDAFNNIRQLLADSQIRDFADLFKLLYDEVDQYAKGHIAETILIVARYSLSDAQVLDKEINAMAMLVELLDEIK